MASQASILFESLVSDPLRTLPVVSWKAKGCGYNRQSNGMHTVQFSTANSFVGIVTIQATLAATPEDADWFDVVDLTLGDNITPVADGAITKNFTGNFTWVRGIITEFTSGSLNRVLYTHN